jgi:hypothetical protein
MFDGHGLNEKTWLEHETHVGFDLENSPEFMLNSEILRKCSIRIGLGLNIQEGITHLRGI